MRPLYPASAACCVIAFDSAAPAFLFRRASRSDRASRSRVADCLYAIFRSLRPSPKKVRPVALQGVVRRPARFCPTGLLDYRSFSTPGLKLPANGNGIQGGKFLSGHILDRFRDLLQSWLEWSSSGLRAGLRGDTPPWRRHHASKLQTTTCLSDTEHDLKVFAEEGNGGLVIVVATTPKIQHQLIVSTAARYRLPAVYPYRFFVDAGGLLSYGPNLIELYR
jgi:hypothetical protein